MFCAVLPILTLAAVMAAQASGGEFRPYIPLFLATCCALLLGLKNGRSWKELSGETFGEVGSVSSAIVLYLLIGPAIAVWIAAGTIPTLIIWGSRVMDHLTYLPLSFILMAVTGTIMGSGISATGSMGIALFGIGHAMGYPVWLLTAVLGSAAFWGNAFSPLAPTNALATGMTGSDLSEYTKRLFALMLPPLLICTALYMAAGYVWTPEQTAVLHFEEMERLFKPSIVTLVPPVLLLTMVLMRVPPTVSFVGGIMAASAVAVLNGNVQLSSLPAILIDGYRASGASPALQALLNRGGIMSMSSVVITIIFAMMFGGSYKASGELEKLLEYLKGFVSSAAGYRRLAICCAVLTTAVTGSTTMSTVLTGTLFVPKAEGAGLSKLDIATALAAPCMSFSPLVPWGVAGSAFLSLLGVSVSDPGTLLYIPVSLLSFLTPLWIAEFGVRQAKKHA